MIDPIGPVNFREGTEEDREGIAAFALALAEDPISSRDKWLQLMNNDMIYPLLAIHKQNIVGKIQARILDNVGWLEKARVRLDFRKMGIANSLVEKAMDWLVDQGVSEIKTLVDSDNVAARKIAERNGFTPLFLSINPNTETSEEDASPQSTEDLAPVLDESLYSHYSSMTKSITGNIMINGQYTVMTQSLFDQLIESRRIYTDYDKTLLFILSKHQLPSEVHGFVITRTAENYRQAGMALRGFAARELATLAICHAPSTREAVVGLAQAGFGWNQPHCLIIYRKTVSNNREP
ncbi:MAG: GNAT family N-acetyltransferase [Candidatus Kariarchaeaceae archaeon]|jgi:ribosomal protein S18 acetylase RimI-like enzyme